MILIYLYVCTTTTTNQYLTNGVGHKSLVENTVIINKNDNLNFPFHSQPL